MYKELFIKLLGAEVFKNYVKYYNDYGDIIKTTLGKAREINKVNCALTMCLSLNMMFNEVQRAGGRNIRQHEEFFALKVRNKFQYQKSLFFSSLIGITLSFVVGIS